MAADATLNGNENNVGNKNYMLTSEMVVAALYRCLLQREPDPEGLAAYVAALDGEPSRLSSVIMQFTSSPEFRSHASGATAPAVAARFTNDHTQFGEFEILMKLWINAFAAHRIVVDVGARGRERSNSFDLLSTFGWRGVLVEANPALIDSIGQDFAGLNFELIHCAASDFDGEAEFHLGVNDDVSSLNRSAAAAWGNVAGDVKVPVKRLGPLLKQRAIPLDFDLLSLDIEGEDVKVLNDLVTTDGYRPRWVIIEASNDFRTKSLSDLDVTQDIRENYDIVGQTIANLMLRSKSF